MKKIINTIVLVMGLLALNGCNDIEIPVLTDEEYPRIIGNWPDKIGDQLGIWGTIVGREFTLNVQFTPSAFCEGTWYVDGVEYAKGTSFAFVSDVAGTHHVKLVVTTPRYTTSREALLTITE